MPPLMRKNIQNMYINFQATDIQYKDLSGYGWILYRNYQ